MARGRQQPGEVSPTSEWVGGRFRAPTYVTGEGPAYRPDVVLWLELGKRRHLHAARVVKPSEPNAVIVASLDEAMGAAGARQRPQVVRVSDVATGELLRAHFGSSLEVRVAPTPELDPVLEDLGRSLGDGPRPASYLAGGASDVQLARLFAAAAALYRVAPWRIVTGDDQLLAVEVPELGLRRGCVSIIGVVGEHAGFALFQSVADHQRFVRLGESGDRPRQLGLSLVTLSFARGSELSPEARREVVRHGWEVADAHAYPWVHVVESDLVERPLTPRDVTLVTLVTEALTRFLDGHRALFAEPAPAPESEAYDLGGTAGPVHVVVVAPHPEAPWDREPTAAEAELQRHLDEEEAEARKLVEGFASARVGAGASEVAVATARAVARSLFELKIHEHDGQAAGLSAEVVERFLLEWVPERVTGADSFFAEVPATLVALVDWLEQSGQLQAQKADVIRRRIARSRERYARYVADPARWSAAKAVFVSAQRAGVDVTDEAAVRRFLEKKRGGIRPAAPGALPPMAVGLTAQVRPNDPCPCGSGKKYKKCCMPR